MADDCSEDTRVLLAVAAHEAGINLSDLNEAPRTQTVGLNRETEST
jgi:hypothetical protein